MSEQPIRLASDGDEWFTVKEAARYLKVSEATIFRWMKSGKLTYCKFGNATRLRRSFLDRMAETITSTSDADELVRRCSVCGHTELAPGKLLSAGSVSFQLDDTRFWALSTSGVPVRALVCTACGHVELFADARRVDRLTSLRTEP